MRLFELAVEADSIHSPAHFALAMHLAARDIGRALEHSRTAYRLDPENEYFKNQLTGLLIANHLFEEAAELNPENIQIQLAMVGHYSRIGDYEHLLATLERLTAQRPDDFALVELHAAALFALERPEEGLQVVKDYISDTVSSAVPYIIIIDGEARLGRRDSLRRWSARALETLENPKELAAVHGQLGAIYNADGKDKRAIREYRMALELDPENIIALNNYAYMLSLAGRDLEKALQMAEKVLQLAPDVPTYIDTYGWVLFRMGRLEDAQKALRRAVSLGGRGEIMRHYGDVLDALGEEFMAKYYRDKADE